MIEVELVGVKVDVSTNSPVMLLQETERPNRTLPVFIGSPEASAIEIAARGLETPRPLTHDLLKDAIEVLGGSLVKVVITELKGGTFYAEMELMQSRGPFIISCRPSDGVALAVRMGTPMFVSEELMELEGVVIEDTVEVERDTDPEPVNQDEIVGEFRDFLDNIKPEDFS